MLGGAPSLPRVLTIARRLQSSHSADESVDVAPRRVFGGPLTRRGGEAQRPLWGILGGLAAVCPRPETVRQFGARARRSG